MSRVVKEVKSAILFESMKELLENGQKVKMTVTGNSMLPFLWEGKDSVELTMCDFDGIDIDDMVLIQRDDGFYVMHRVIRKEDNAFYMVGDCQTWIEGPLRPDQLRAKITAIYKGRRKIEATQKTYRTLVFLWRLLLPVRGIILKLMRGVYRCLRPKKAN